MSDMTETLVKRLNAPERERRLEALEELMKLYRGGGLEGPVPTENVNNHIHTIYSFSPYSPAKAAYMAWMNGLTTAGIMDHDSIAGAEEFIRAGELIGIATTVGFELRCRMDGTPFGGRRINNPDQDSVAYLAMHGIPHGSIPRVAEFLAPWRARREERNRAMVGNINALLGPAGIALDYEKDVRAISMAHEGGSVTERHLLYALGNQITALTGKGQPAVDFLRETLGIEVAGKNLDMLRDPDNTMYDYYLLGVLKSSLVEQIYVDADEECPAVTEFIALGEEIGAITAYAYLGDVGDSVTGDKKTQKFEDAYLDELIPWLAGAGFRAVTYMPTRNTPEQLDRLMGLCEANDLFQISGEDINSPFQSFVCEALSRPQFRHLITATWALIGHEKVATQDLAGGMFSPQTLADCPGLNDRIARFAAIGRES